MTDKLNETFSKENSTLNQVRYRSSSDIISDSVLKVAKLAIKDGFQVYKITVNLVKDAVMKSARVLVIFKRIEADGSQIIFSEPSVEEIEKENFDKTVKLFIITKKSISEIENRISNVSEVESVHVEEFEVEGFETAEISSTTSTTSSNSQNQYEKVLLTKIGNQIYAIPISEIDMLVAIDPKEIKYIDKIKVALVEDRIIPLADMREYFGHKSSSSMESAVIVKGESEKYGLIVDDFMRITEAAVKTLGKIFEKREFCGAIVENNSIALMLDISYIVENFSQILRVNMDTHGEHHVQPAS